MNREPTSNNLQEHIIIVDDDEAVRDSLQWLLETDGHVVLTYESAEKFLESFDPHHPAVLLLDVRLQGMSGLELQEKLLTRNIRLPIIFITGHGDVSMAVQTMKKGAADFLEKPFDEALVRELVRKNLDFTRVLFAEQKKIDALENLFSKLTSREIQVLGRIVAGRMNKQIADDLNISIKTVEAHRASIMDKLKVDGMADLVKLALARQKLDMPNPAESTLHADGI